MRKTLAISLILGVLIIDQLIKLWVKTSFQYYEEIPLIPGFFHLLFIENNGMAFGLELGGSYGKLFLSLFRVVAVFAIGYYLLKFIKEKRHKLLIACISLILSGAIGNIIDSVFYGKIFSASCGNHRMQMPCDPVAQLFPAQGGYGQWFHGEVVDMFQFTVFWPQWMPWVGNNMVFPPIFNFADLAISVGVMLLIIFQKRIFGTPQKSVLHTAPTETGTEERPN